MEEEKRIEERTKTMSTPFKHSSQNIMMMFYGLHGLRGQMDLTFGFKIGYSN
jgi:hypothetical protein